MVNCDVDESSGSLPSSPIARGCHWSICRQANNQHKLCEEISADPQETSFFMAMQLCDGVLVVHVAYLDRRGITCRLQTYISKTFDADWHGP